MALGGDNEINISNGGRAEEIDIHNVIKVELKGF